MKKKLDIVWEIWYTINNGKGGYAVKKYTLLALVLLSLVLLLVGCNDWNDPPMETPSDSTDFTAEMEITTEAPTTEELTTEEITTEEITTEEITTEEMTTEKIPEHTGDYSKPY